MEIGLAGGQNCEEALKISDNELSLFSSEGTWYTCKIHLISVKYEVTGCG